jgi:hypothetical protein
LESAYRRFSELADRKKRIYDQDLISLVAVQTDLPNEAVVAVDGREWARAVTA